MELIITGMKKVLPMLRRSQPFPKKFKLRVHHIAYLQCFIIISLLCYIATLTVFVTHVEKKFEAHEQKTLFENKIPFQNEFNTLVIDSVGKDNTIQRNGNIDEEDRIKDITDKVSFATTENSFNSNDTKQTLILHVGPPKTASTTIQDALRVMSRRIYNEDSYIVMYKVFSNIEAYSKSKSKEINYGGGFPFSFTSLESDLNATADHRTIHGEKYYWDYVVSHFFRVARKEKKNVLLSAEEFCFDRFPDNDFTWNLVLPELQKWDVQVVVTYRRYFEWLTSWYFRMVSNKFRLNEFATEFFFRDKYVSFQTFFNDTLSDAQKLIHDGAWMDVHPTQHAIRKFGKHFQNIKQFNLHQSKNHNEVVRDFICNVISNPTNTTCQALTEMEYVTGKKNEGANVNFGLLVHAFHNQGLISDGEFKAIFRHNSFLRNKFQEKIKNTFPAIEVPYKCLSHTQLQQLLNMSLSFEKYLQPKWFQSNGVKEDHVNKFWNAVESKKYCDLDFDEIFRNQKEGTKYYPLFNFIVKLKDKALDLDEDPHEETMFLKQHKEHGNVHNHRREYSRVYEFASIHHDRDMGRHHDWYDDEIERLRHRDHGRKKKKKKKKKKPQHHPVIK